MMLELHRKSKLKLQKHYSFPKNICIKTTFRSSNVIVSFSTPNEDPINVRKSTGPYAIWSSNIILIRLCFKGCFESK